MIENDQVASIKFEKFSILVEPEAEYIYVDGGAPTFLALGGGGASAHAEIFASAARRRRGGVHRRTAKNQIYF
jgi:hypothetical protein